MTISATGDWDAWQRQCLIEISDGTTIMTLHAITETIDIDIGERDLDVINLLNLGQIAKHGAGVGITTITLEGYCLEAGSIAAGAATGFWDFFAQKPAMDVAEPQTNSLTVDATRFRVTVLWTNETTASAASGEIAAAQKAKRFVIADCFCTGCKESFTDGILKTTLSFKGSAFNKSASARVKMESHDATGAVVLSALGNYTPGTTPWA